MELKNAGVCFWLYTFTPKASFVVTCRNFSNF